MLEPYPYPHELAVAAILKNEGDYIAEWLDYHLAAGVTKFYLYDNDSTDNVHEILRPYIARGVVEYRPFPGSCMQISAYSDALYRHKFDCRYLAVIDLDEFIYPLHGELITSLVPEIFKLDANAGGFIIRTHVFGSAGYKESNLSQGVLARFTRRGSDDFSGNGHLKTIANPRCVDVFQNPHMAAYYVGRYAIDELGQPVRNFLTHPVSTQKIILHHYFTKSYAEFIAKCRRGLADLEGLRSTADFDKYDVNDVFDDGIVKYREVMRSALSPKSTRKIKDIIDTVKALSDMPNDAFGNRIEDLLGYLHFCQSELPLYLGRRAPAKSLADSVLNAVAKAFTVPQAMWQCELFMSVLPEIMAVNKVQAREIAVKIVPLMQRIYRKRGLWAECERLSMLMRLI